MPRKKIEKPITEEEIIQIGEKAVTEVNKRKKDREKEAQLPCRIKEKAEREQRKKEIMAGRKAYREVQQTANDITVKMLQDNLPQYVEERASEFDKLLSQYIEDTKTIDITRKKINNYKLTNYITKPFVNVPFYGGTPPYTANNLTEITNYIEYMLYKANEVEITILDLTDFCRILNISKSTFTKWWKYGDDDMREACQRAVDMLAGFLNKAGLYGKVDTYMATFVQKSLHELRDNFDIVQPQTVVNNYIGNDSDVMQKLRQSRSTTIYDQEED